MCDVEIEEPQRRESPYAVVEPVRDDGTGKDKESAIVSSTSGGRLGTASSTAMGLLMHDDELTRIVWFHGSEYTATSSWLAIVSGWR